MTLSLTTSDGGGSSSVVPAVGGTPVCRSISGARCLRPSGGGCSTRQQDTPPTLTLAFSPLHMSHAARTADHSAHLRSFAELDTQWTCNVSAPPLSPGVRASIFARAARSLARTGPLARSDRPARLLGPGPCARACARSAGSPLLYAGNRVACPSARLGKYCWVAAPSAQRLHSMGDERVRPCTASGRGRLAPCVRSARCRVPAQLPDCGDCCPRHRRTRAATM